MYAFHLSERFIPTANTAHAIDRVSRLSSSLRSIPHAADMLTFERQRGTLGERTRHRPEYRGNEPGALACPPWQL